MTRDEAIRRLNRGEGLHGALFRTEYATALVNALEALGLLKLDTPESVHAEGVKFITDMAKLWSGAASTRNAVEEDLRAAKLQIVRVE